MKIPVIENPVMIDKVISHIQNEIAAKLDWLDYSFGRCQKLVKTMNGGEYIYPAVYAGESEYVDVLPSEEYGNRTFFVIDDPQTIETEGMRYKRISCPFSLVCWYDITTVLNNRSQRNTEEVKRQIVGVLTNCTMPRGARLELKRIYENPESIFRGFSIREINTQYMMHPYAGIRIEGIIYYVEQCD